MTNTLTLYPEHMFGGPRVDGMPARIFYEFLEIKWCEVHDCQIPGGTNPDERCWFDFRYAVSDKDGKRVRGSLECETIMKWLETRPSQKKVGA